MRCSANAFNCTVKRSINAFTSQFFRAFRQTYSPTPSYRIRSTTKIARIYRTPYILTFPCVLSSLTNVYRTFGTKNFHVDGDTFERLARNEVANGFARAKRTFEFQQKHIRSYKRFSRYPIRWLCLSLNCPSIGKYTTEDDSGPCMPGKSANFAKRRSFLPKHNHIRNTTAPSSGGSPK